MSEEEMLEIEKIYSSIYKEISDNQKKLVDKLIKYTRELKEDYNNELEENLKLSELWCKSQQENKQLKEVIDEVREYINDKLFDDYTYCSYEDVKQNINEILDKAKENK